VSERQPGPVPRTPAESDVPAELRSSVVWRAMTLLELLSRTGEGVGVRDAARQTGIDRSAVSRILGQLEQMGCVQQERERGVYAAGPRLFAIAAALRGRDSLWMAAQPILEALAAEHGETCYLTVREGDSVVFREKVDCDHTIRYVVELGKAFPLASGAAGTAILAGLPVEEARAVLEGGIEPFTDASITGVEDYLAQLEVDRAQGYSVSRGRWVANGAGVASPWFAADGRCGGALTLSCPAFRLEAMEVDAVGRSVLRAARALSDRLGHVGSWGPPG
jgi:DNA-binding IclR family transcriptional regulator